jgi:hypothetical protein
VIPAGQVKPGEPTPHFLIAMQAQAAAMRFSPKREGVGIPFTQIPEEARLIIEDPSRPVYMSPESVRRIAEYLGVEVGQISQILLGPGVGPWWAHIPESSYEMVNVTLRAGKSFLGILGTNDFFFRPGQRPDYGVVMLERTYPAGVSKEDLEKIAGYLGIRPGRIEKVEAVYLPLQGESRLGIRVTLKGGGQYLGIAEGGYGIRHPPELYPNLAHDKSGNSPYRLWPIPPPDDRILFVFIHIERIVQLGEARSVITHKQLWHSNVANVWKIARYLGVEPWMIGAVDFVRMQPDRYSWYQGRPGMYEILVTLLDGRQYIGTVSGRVLRDGRLSVRGISDLRQLPREGLNLGPRSLANIARYLGMSVDDISEVRGTWLRPGAGRLSPQQLEVVVTLKDGRRFLGVLVGYPGWRFPPIVIAPDREGSGYLLTAEWTVYRVRFLREIQTRWFPRPPVRPVPIRPIRPNPPYFDFERPVLRMGEEKQKQ